MEHRSIDLPELFKYSFQQYKRHVSFVFGVMVTYYVLAIVPQAYLLMNSAADPSTQRQLISGVLITVQLFLTVGFIKVMLLLIDGRPVEVSDLFNNFSHFLSYFLAYFIYLFAVLLGLFLFIVPGIFIAVRFQFYPYFILEDNETSLTSLQKSYYLTEDLTLELFLFGISVVALNLAGALLLGIGIIFTYPLTTMATAALYKSLRAGSGVLPSKSYRN